MNIIQQHEDYRPVDVRERKLTKKSEGLYLFVERDSADQLIRTGTVTADELPERVRDHADRLFRIFNRHDRTLYNKMTVPWESESVTERVDRMLLSKSADARMNIIHASFMELTEDRIERGLTDENWHVRMGWLSRAGYILTREQAERALTDESWDVRMAALRRNDLGLAGLNDLSFIKDDEFRGEVENRIEPTDRNVQDALGHTALTIESIYDAARAGKKIHILGVTMGYPVALDGAEVIMRKATIEANPNKKGMYRVLLHEDYPRSGSCSSIFNAMRWMDNTITNDLKQERMSVSMPSVVDQSADQAVMRPD